MVGGVALSSFAITACNQAEKEESQKVETEVTVSPEDSLKQVILEREKENGALKISLETLKDLNDIENELRNSEPGDSVGLIPVYYAGEDRGISGVSGKLGHENKYNKTDFSFFVHSDGIFIDCFTYGPETDGLINKHIDKDGVVVGQYWLQNFKLNKEDATKMIDQFYDRYTGTFSQTYDAYNINENGGMADKVENLSGSIYNLTERPELPSEVYTEIGGSPEHFFKSAIEAYKQAKAKSKK